MICEQYVVCVADSLFSEDCAGCGACALACPQGAIELIEVEDKPSISISVNGEKFEVPDGITVKDALSLCGLKVGKTPDIQVCVLDYRPTFRRMDILQPTRTEMLTVKKTLNNAGLSTVMIQTG
jgi:Fe-S-cluster-containing hydrogenase component 2